MPIATIAIAVAGDSSLRVLRDGRMGSDNMQPIREVGGASWSADSRLGERLRNDKPTPAVHPLASLCRESVMQSWALRYLIRLGARYAAFGALFYMGLGVLWIDGHVQMGQERDRFMRGAVVSGTVGELFPSEQIA